MLTTLRDLVRETFAWRRQVGSLAIITLRKQTSNTALGWAWIVIKPLVYIICFWFALYIGLRGGSSDMTSAQYLIWLAAGVVPWMFLQSAIQEGSHVFNTLKYLVNKLKFPVVVIPVFYELASLLSHFMLMAIYLLVYFLMGGRPTVQFTELLLLFALMYIFAVGWCLMTAPLTAMSKDVKNLIKTLGTPIFWLSGVIFDVSSISSQLVQTVLLFNPVTFLIEGYRSVLCNGSIVGEGASWMWSDPVFFGCGVGVIAATFICGLFVFSRLRENIPDVL